MAKYHVRMSGEPGVCRAREGNCPFGADTPHYASQEDARDAYEQSMKDQGVVSARRTSSNTVLKNRISRREEQLRQVSKILNNSGYNPHVRGEFTDHIEAMTQITEQMHEVIGDMQMNPELFTETDVRRAEAFQFSVYLNIRAAELNHYRKYVKKGRGFLGRDKSYYDPAERQLETYLTSAMGDAPRWLSEKTKQEVLQKLLAGETVE